jgi:hypothetical protein
MINGELTASGAVRLIDVVAVQKTDHGDSPCKHVREGSRSWDYEIDCATTMVRVYGAIRCGKS